MTDKQPEALRLAARLCDTSPWFKPPTDLELAAAAELRRLHQQELANAEWFGKTDWLKPAPHELGMHRADVLRQRIERLTAENEALRADAERYRWLRDADRSDNFCPEIFIYAMESLDEAIDAAMKGQP